MADPLRIYIAFQRGLKEQVAYFAPSFFNPILIDYIAGFKLENSCDMAGAVLEREDLVAGTRTFNSRITIVVSLALGMLRRLQIHCISGPESVFSHVYSCRHGT
ncbi:MAG: hypothetical protein K0Q94_441 [Paenibacillus sp.]|nr:hypothetical protein [Paenibacillus sp.]